MFYFYFTVSAILPAIDLLEALELRMNHSRYIGVSTVQGMEKHMMAYKLGNQYVISFMLEIDVFR